jgi:hypothetical protein
VVPWNFPTNILYLDTQIFWKNKVTNTLMLRILFNFDVYVTHVQQMVHTRHPQSPISISRSVAPKLAPLSRSNRCQVSVCRKWQLASRRRLLQIACQRGDSYSAYIDGNHTAKYCQLGLRLIAALWLTVRQNRSDLCTNIVVYLFTYLFRSSSPRHVSVSNYSIVTYRNISGRIWTQKR